MGGDHESWVCSVLLKLSNEKVQIRQCQTLPRGEQWMGKM